MIGVGVGIGVCGGGGETRTHREGFWFNDLAKTKRADHDVFACSRYGKKSLEINPPEILVAVSNLRLSSLEDKRNFLSSISCFEAAHFSNHCNGQMTVF